MGQKVCMWMICSSGNQYMKVCMPFRGHATCLANSKHRGVWHMICRLQNVWQYHVQGETTPVAVCQNVGPIDDPRCITDHLKWQYLALRMQTQLPFYKIHHC